MCKSIFVASFIVKQDAVVIPFFRRRWFMVGLLLALHPPDTNRADTSSATENIDFVGGRTLDRVHQFSGSFIVSAMQLFEALFIELVRIDGRVGFAFG